MSRVFDLTHTLHVDIPTFGGDEQCCSFQPLATVQKDGWFNRQLVLQEHVGTHIDAPSHFDVKGSNVDEIDAESSNERSVFLLQSHLLFLSELVGPLVLLDVAAACRSSDEYSISEFDVLKHEKLKGELKHTQD